jgi:mono/diheme cytochrome c family protein
VTRREREAGRAASERRRRLAGWGVVALVLVIAVVVLVVVLAGGGDEPSVLTPESELARGEELFQANCATCHGTDLRGTFVGPPLLHEIYAPDQLPDDSIRAAVANGVQPKSWEFAAMPSFPNLGTDDVEALIVYVRSSQRAAGLGAADTTANATTSP